MLRIAVDAVKDVDIDRLVVLDSGDGAGVSNAANQRVRGALGTIEGLSSSLGIDIEGALRGAAGQLTGAGEALATPPAARPAAPRPAPTEGTGEA